MVRRYFGFDSCCTTTFIGGSTSAKTLSFGYFAPPEPCITNDHRPPDLNSQTLNVLVNPAGPHQRANLCGSLNAANTSSGDAGISREVRNVVFSLGLSSS